MLRFLQSAAMIGAAVLCLLFSGCGAEDEGVTVRGRVTDNGQPLRGGGSSLAQLEFRNYGGGEASAKSLMDTRTVALNEDGSYEVTLPKGEYFIVVQQFDEYRGPNKLAAVFPPDKSPLKKTIDSSQELDIEVKEYRK